MLTEEGLAENRRIKEEFLDLREIPKEYLFSEHKFNYPNDVFGGYIYCIENKKNGMKYIGSAGSIYAGVKNPEKFHAMKKRASQYLYEYNRAKNLSRSLLATKRHILRALVEEGIENFVMYPIAEVGIISRFRIETYFIEKYHTFSNGYNESIPKVCLGTSVALSEKLKAQRAHKIICINLNSQEIIFSDSMRLFANFVGTTKDQIKNNARFGRTYKGWFIFYRDYSKRHEILKRVLGDKLQTENDPCSRNHSEKSKKFYQEFVETIDSYLNRNSGKVFTEFKILPELSYDVEV